VQLVPVTMIIKNIKQELDETRLILIGFPVERETTANRSEEIITRRIHAPAAIILKIFCFSLEPISLPVASAPMATDTISNSPFPNN
jgi:hypothetical protein